MNVLQIVQRGCQSIGIPSPASLIAATTTVDLQLRAILYDVHDFLRNQRIFVQQKRAHVFDLEADRQFYPLPEDFYAALLGTQYDDTTKYPLLGPLTDSQFDMREYGLAGFSPIPAYRIFGPDNNPYSAGGQFQVWPMPTAAGDTISFEYQSRNLFQPPNWTPSTVYALNAYVNANGNIYQCTTTGASSATTAPAGQSLTPQANGTAFFVYRPAAYETIVANTDTSIFDDDLVQAGFKAYYYESKGQPQAAGAMNDFRKQIDSARNRYYGSYRGVMSRFKKYPYAGISPQGNWDMS
jgi:hypothetical protein